MLEKLSVNMPFQNLISNILEFARQGKKKIRVSSLKGTQLTLHGNSGTKMHGLVFIDGRYHFLFMLWSYTLTRKIHTVI